MDPETPKRRGKIVLALVIGAALFALAMAIYALSDARDRDTGSYLPRPISGP